MQHGCRNPCRRFESVDAGDWPAAGPPRHGCGQPDFPERLTLQENLIGRAVLNKAVSVMYAVSDSGVTILPVGSLNQYNRVEPGQEDVLVQTGFCNQSNVSQTFTLADPGGNHTDFELTPGPAFWFRLHRVSRRPPSR